MKRTAIVLGIAAAMGVAPTAALGGNQTAQVDSQVASTHVVRQVVQPAVVRTAVVRTAVVRTARAERAILRSDRARAARVGQIRALLR